MQLISLTIFLTMGAISCASSVPDEQSSIEREVTIYKRLVELGCLPAKLKIVVSNPVRIRNDPRADVLLRKLISDAFPTLHNDAIDDLLPKLQHEELLADRLCKLPGWQCIKKPPR